jgi:hypothetical protein
MNAMRQHDPTWKPHPKQDWDLVRVWVKTTGCKCRLAAYEQMKLLPRSLPDDLPLYDLDSSDEEED